MKALVVTLVCLLPVTFGLGYRYATRNNDILVKFTEMDRASKEAVDNFSRVIQETDWCNGQTTEEPRR